MIEELEAFALLRGLSGEQLAAVADTAQLVSYAARDRIFEEGGEAGSCWLIRSGHVALDSPVPGRGMVVVQTLGPGDVLGWSWLTEARRWEFGGAALDAVEAIQLDGAKLHALADADPVFGYRLALGILESVTVRLHNTRVRLLDMYASRQQR